MTQSFIFDKLQHILTLQTTADEKRDNISRKKLRKERLKY